FLAYEPAFTGGVSVAVADVTGDGVPDVVTAPGPGGGPVVRVFSGKDGSVVGTVMAFEPSFRTGGSVAAADLNGDCTAGGVARDGVRVAAGDLTGDGLAEIVTAPGAGSTHVRVIDPQSGAGLSSFFAGRADAVGGVRVAVRDGELLVGSGPGDGVLAEAYSGL